MKITLIVNKRKKDAESYAQSIVAYLEERNILYSVFREERYSKAELAESDAIVTLGGDGTILRAADTLQGREIPILGINVGHLGYLTEINRKEDIRAALDALLSGNYIPDTRKMIRGRVYRQGQMIAEGLALNEILLSRKNGISIVRYNIFYNGKELGDYSADGIIVSTPTGSTAYNLSAGGPIVSPTAPVHILTPICAHSLNGRAIVLNNTRMIEVYAKSENSVLAFDGENIVDLEVGDVIRIYKAEEQTTLVKLHKESFLEILREKMKEA